jgi:heme oxygenase
VDALSFSENVAAGTVAIARYASFLRALDAVYAELEHAVTTCPLESLRSAAAILAERRAELGRDVALLGVDRRGVDAAVLRALVLAQSIRLDASSAPETLLGHLFVLEGAQLHCVSLTSELLGRPELQSGGCRYLASKADRVLRLEDYASLLSAAPAREQAILGAQHALDGLEPILGVIASGQYNDVLAGVLNPDAGTHSIPNDVREVHAALLAGERSRQAWPYYEARYGERGLRFTRSDSAWLVTLLREGPETAAKQIAWLGRVLAARGMPRYLLELHLLELHRELVAQVPELADDYVMFQTLAKQLASARHAVLRDAEFDALARGFAPGGVGPLEPGEAGQLLVAAVIDEKLGLAEAVASLTKWLADPANVSGAWVEAVKRTVEAARAACGRS